MYWGCFVLFVARLLCAHGVATRDTKRQGHQHNEEETKSVGSLGRTNWVSEVLFKISHFFVAPVSSLCHSPEHTASQSRFCRCNNVFAPIQCSDRVPCHRYSLWPWDVL
eukprot:PhF_6_TR17017/c0_g2_i2/m.25795